MQNNNKSQSLGNIIKIYSSWKAIQPKQLQQSHLIEHKLNPKFNPLKPPSEKLLPKRKQINLVEMKSKELIPDRFAEEEQETTHSHNHQENNLRKFTRKNSTGLAITRYQSVDHNQDKNNKQNILRIKLIDKTEERQPTAHSPTALQIKFRIKESPKKHKSPDHKSTLPFKSFHWKEFLQSNPKEKSHFLKQMTRTDLQVLTHNCPIDMEPFLLKIRLEQQLRKARSISHWTHFNYNEIQQ